MSRTVPMRGALVAAVAALLAGCVPAEPVSAPMALSPEQRSLVQEIGARPDLTRYAAALRIAGPSRLAQTAPVTVFVANDEAFSRLAPDVPAALLQPENRALLSRTLAYHVVEGALDVAALRARVVAGGGRARLQTLAGEPLTVTLTADVLTLTDADGDPAYFTGPEVRRGASVLHVVNALPTPTLAP